MKKILSTMLVLGFLVSFSGLVFAAETTTRQVTTAPAAATGISVQQRKLMEARASNTLTAQPWTVYRSLQGVKKPRVETDVLTFTGNEMVSQDLSLQGFSPSNYALRLQEDGTGIIETMQSGPNDSMAVCRGEVRGEVLMGELSINHKNGAVESYVFTSETPRVAVEPVKKAK